MEYILIISVALLASMLTFFSGFGLGTMLTPVFILYFPPEIAVAMTAIVHFLNNLFKLILVGKHAVWKVILRFGLPAMVGAYFGAKLLAQISLMNVDFTFSVIETSAIKMVLGILIGFFAIVELSPKLSNIEFAPKWLTFGGVLSGFFGGLSGHQGALRSAFLLRFGLTKEAFIATGIYIACLVDLTRLGTYAENFNPEHFTAHYTYIIAGTLSAFAGAILGKQLLKKVTLDFLQKIVGGLMLIIGLLLFLGII